MENFDIKKVQPNQKIEIIKNNSMHSYTIITANANCILAQKKVDEYSRSLININDNIEYCIYIEATVYRCRSNIIGIKEERGLQVAVLSKPEVIGRSERRQYHRLPISLEAFCFIIPRNETYNSITSIPSQYFSMLQRTTTLDISGGGVRILSNVPAEVGSQVLVRFFAPDSIVVICNVIRSKQRVSDSKYELALKYEIISEKIRHKINYFIFTKLKHH